MTGQPCFYRSQSRWIARQQAQYRSVPRTSETWRVLFAAFEARYPNGGYMGRCITLQQYRNHVHYIERRMNMEATKAVAGTHYTDLVRRSETPRLKRETGVPLTPSPQPSPSRSKLLRTRATAAVLAAAEPARAKRRRSTEEPRDAKRLRSVDHTSSTGDDDLVIKQEVGVDRLFQAELDRNKLAGELKECQASLKRMKQSAHAWKVKYEELLATRATTAATPTGGRPSDHSFTFTMNVNVDVSQNGAHVRTDRHAMRVHVDGGRSAEKSQ